MADWEKLNKQFNEVLDNMTDQDWQDWLKNRERNRAERRKNLVEQARNHMKVLECGKCDCIEKEIEKQGSELLKNGYPCLKDMSDESMLRKKTHGQD
jgi:hydroxypyruvate isomerase